MEGCTSRAPHVVFPTTTASTQGKKIIHSASLPNLRREAGDHGTRTRTRPYSHAYSSATVIELNLGMALERIEEEFEEKVKDVGGGKVEAGGEVEDTSLEPGPDIEMVEWLGNELNGLGFGKDCEALSLSLSLSDSVVTRVGSPAV